MKLLWEVPDWVCQLVVWLAISYASCTASLAQCNQTYSWVAWSSFQDNKAVGALQVDGRQIQVDVTTNFPMGSTKSIYAFGEFTPFPEYSSLPATTTPRMVWSKEGKGEVTICFSEPVTNPVLLIASLGGPDTTVNLTFSRSYVPLFQNGGAEPISATKLRGTEGYAVLLFPGTFSCLTVDADRYEYYTNINFGVRPSAMPLAISAPQPGCNNSSVTATGGTMYQWDGGQKPGNGTNVFDRSGTYTVKATDDKGCIAYAMTTVSVPSPTEVRFGTYPPLCNGQAITLGPSVKAATNSVSYRWASGETTPAITVAKPGTYEVTVQDGGCVKTASVVVAPARSPSLKPDATVCLSGPSTTLEAGATETSMTYNWLSVNSKAQTVNVSQPGRYQVKVTNPLGCTAIRTIDVVTTPTVSLDRARAICLGEETDLIPTVGGPANPVYHWSTGSVEPSIRVSEPGTYQLTVANGQCAATASLALAVNPLPSVLPDETVCRGKIITAGSLEPSVTYRWDNKGETTPEIAIQAEGVYRVAITNPMGCSVVRTITVSGICASHILAPTGFTPNADGMNDAFAPAIVQGDVVELAIYNRWGELVYNERSDRPTWDGTQQGQACPNGSYSYRLVYRTIRNDGDQIYNGTIVLLR
ncbi:gliding motility-associated C-terminal domain-containing protein [Fibrella sp. WM1]|uniref:gliding motility-associated C-terminal domain-containing protein n=1 Tax=Fibrella musci TaxID=3242485 RepID=UPI003522EC82